MMHYNQYLFCILCFYLASSSLAFSTSPLAGKIHGQRVETALFYDESLDKARSAEPLTLTAEDLATLHNLRTRVVTIPIVLMDAILPQQELSFISDDRKAALMLKHALESETPEIGVIGFNPHDGSPLNKGVTAPIAPDQITYGIESDSDMSMGIKLKGHRCFDVLGEPFMDDTNSFYLANVEITDRRKETMTEEMEEKAEKYFSMIEDQVGDFVYWMKKEEIMSNDELTEHLETLGPLPDDLKERALWVGSLVNPVPALSDVCPDIRPALLSCRNSHDRLAVASIALHAGIDRLSNARH
ncbi:unnamed protein product [Cylindrotheca closterium]|uniref:Uncharacterized protein n=1 Tax=Cylindrotheca closterium TaxID=2856 RepID=A0AAD2CUL2_9STRA|nr:unnamed protein product [Cylindrotheca closterium]